MTRDQFLCELMGKYWHPATLKCGEALIEPVNNPDFSLWPDKGRLLDFCMGQKWWSDFTEWFYWNNNMNLESRDNLIKYLITNLPALIAEYKAISRREAMTDTDAIRKKHERDIRTSPHRLIDKSILTVAEVDAIFSALDARNDLLTLCEKQRDKTVERNDQLKAALDEARGRVEKAIEQCDTEYGYVPVVGFKLIRRILKGGGDG